MNVRLPFTELHVREVGVESSALAMLDALPEIVFVTDPGGPTVFVNAHYRGYTGLPADVLLDGGWAEVVHPEDRPATSAAWRAALAEGRPVEVEYRLRRADGVFRWFKGRAAPHRDGAGAIRAWVGTCTDVHDLKTAEAAAREAEAWLRLAQEASGVGTFAWTPATSEMRWSAECKAIFGLPPEAEMSDELFMSRIHPDDRALVLEAVERAFDPEGEGRYRSEYRALWPDGTVRWVDARGRVTFAPGPGARTGVRFIGTVLDITEAKRVEAGLAQAVEMKDALLYELNHRVKNNLQVVAGLLAMQAGRSDSPEVRRQLVEAQARVEVVGAIHRSLYASGAHGAVDIPAFLLRLAEDTVSAQGDGRVALEVAARCEAVLPLAQALPLALIVSELLINAVKYAVPEGRSGTVRLGLDRRGDRLRVEIADDGPGLPEGFDPRRSGGLGMRIVAALVGQLDSRLEIGPPGRGAVFALEVPLPPSD
ncbi:sensor histidine kinase [Rubellimicrobium roseum]|nr:PAS domain-containing protein [Rubellimicrobium roseum]